ncbi:glycine cleavage T C-terminal barrel domain-containing protein [Pontivivens ytuae]|uniref:Glycine cleavage system protein T n=1 Tax=Pontivivens ytuae TaxID=2789856 RepID=A0A7S9QCX1_9RHOB|nr:glycine cleavage T C-terminal barrel domain-containing protein [Pontivivens ytuae]QPH54383.1 glycine cleavage system protein T [Pontivivens ytuae]
MYGISMGTRIRRSPYHAATVAAGVTSFTTYNHMLMPTSYGDPQAEYRRLIDGVAMWDVAVERQIALKGPDAQRLAQALCCRELSKLKPGQGRYVALCDHRGVLINDPVLLLHEDGTIWLFIADSDVLLWARAVAAERRLDVEVEEEDIAPLAVQGPKAEDVIADLFGEDIRAIRHFGFREERLGDIPLVLARSGWSKQGGFELYLRDSRRATELWNRVAEAGAPYDIGPGAPNPSERIESGLLSVGADTDDATTPFEVRMERFVDLEIDADVIGLPALQAEAARGPKRHQLGVVFPKAAPDSHAERLTLTSGNRRVGEITATAPSPRMGKTIGLALVSREVEPGAALDTILPDGRSAPVELRELPFL